MLVVRAVNTGGAAYRQRLCAGPSTMQRLLHRHLKAAMSFAELNVIILHHIPVVVLYLTSF